MNNIWISIELEESLGRDLWTQNLTLIIDAVTAALQETQDQAHDQSSQTLLVGCSLAKSSLSELNLVELSLVELSLAELSLAESSRAELSCNQLTEYDWWI